MNIPVAYTKPGHGPNPFQQPESMGKRRQASPAPLEREAKDIFFARLFFSFFCVRLFFCARLRAHASRVRRLEAEARQARRAAQRGKGLAAWSRAAARELLDYTGGSGVSLWLPWRQATRFLGD